MFLCSECRRLRSGSPQPSHASIWCNLGSQAAPRALTSEAPLYMSQYFRVWVLCAAGSILGLDVRGRRLEERARPREREDARMPTCMNKTGLSNTRARQHPLQVCSLFSPVYLYYKEVLQDENLELEAKIKIERTE